jgi:hypothetical protein
MNVVFDNVNIIVLIREIVLAVCITPIILRHQLSDKLPIRFRNTDIASTLSNC